MAPEQPSFVRQWLLLKILSARRDLETFREVGFPLQDSVGDHGRKAWSLDPAKTQPGLGFAFDEAVALYLGRRFLDPLAGSGRRESSDLAAERIVRGPHQVSGQLTPPG